MELIPVNSVTRHLNTRVVLISKLQTYLPFELLFLIQSFISSYIFSTFLFRHMDSAHSTKTEEEKRAEREANKVMCPTCGKTYQTSAGLQFHIAKSHAPKEELPFRCAYCPKAFLHKYHLDNHENQQHTGIRAFKCGLCDKTFAVKNIRDKHERFVCKKVLNYPCELCPKKFSSNTKRDHHILSVHTEDSQKPFQCSYCSKGFATKFTLSEHENTHTNARPNLCPICGMGFNNQASRNAHVKNKHPKDGDVKPVIPKPAPPPPQVTTTPQPVVVASPPPQQQQQHQVQVLQIHPSAQQQHHQHQVPQQLLIQQGPGQPPQVVSVVQQVVVSQPMQFNN